MMTSGLRRLSELYYGLYGKIMIVGNVNRQRKLCEAATPINSVHIDTRFIMFGYKGRKGIQQKYNIR